MKTKLIAFLISISGMSFGQEWSPIGAEWYYDITYVFIGDIDYFKIYCDSIVNFKGHNCKKINVDFRACNNHFGQKLYTFNKQDTIYFYNQDIDTFEILYNFNAKQGDSWQIKTKDYKSIIDTVIVYVDSSSIREINSKILKVLYVSYKYNYKFGPHQIQSYKDNSTIVESLGDLNFLINIIDKYSGNCDASYVHSLRCYNDNVLGQYSSGLRDSCTYTFKWTYINSNQKLNNLYVYPNPTNDKIFIKTEKNDKINYVLYNLNGLIICSGDKTFVNLSSFQDGIYLLRLTINKSDTKTFKIIKHVP